MTGELSVIGQCILISMTIVYSTILLIIGRRLNAPSSWAAYVTSASVLVAFPLLSEDNVHLLDQVLGIRGAGMLFCHSAFMVLFCGLFLCFVLMRDKWSWHEPVAIGGAIFLQAIFVPLWLHVKTLEPQVDSLFYGPRLGHPASVFWMNVSMGSGLAYIAMWNLIEFISFLRSTRMAYEKIFASVAIVLFALSAFAGTLTITETVGDFLGYDMAGVLRSKAILSLLVIAATICILASQTWLRPMWRNRRQILLRFIEPELVQLRNDLLNLSATEAELHLDLHHETYANRAIVDAVAARCREEGVSAGRIAIARMAVSLITFERDNVIQDPSYGTISSWYELVEEAAQEIDEMIALTSWEKALRDNYVTQQVYIVMFLVLDSRAYREILLINERPQIQPWHEKLTNIIATVMYEHGQPTPRYAAIAAGISS